MEDFRKRLGLQFFADGAEGEAAPAEDAALDSVFTSTLLEEGLEDAPEEPGEEQPAPEEEETPMQPAQTPETQEEQEPEEDREENYVAAEVGGQQVQLPLAAVQALSDALGADCMTLLQRGAAYDAKAGRELAILDDYARAAGMDREAYLGFLERTRDEQQVKAEMDALRTQYPEGTPDAALRDLAQAAVTQRQASERAQRAMQEMQARQLQAQQAQAAQAQKQAALRQEIEQFRAAHPGIQTSADVPEEVWDRIQQADGALSLTAAYAMYERDQARQEAEQAREQMKAMQKNEENRASSPGSMAGAADSAMSDFARILLS